MNDNAPENIIMSRSLYKEFLGPRKEVIVLAIENVSNFQMHNEPRLFQRIF